MAEPLLSSSMSCPRSETSDRLRRLSLAMRTLGRNSSTPPTAAIAIELKIAWAALRDRERPVLINARPAPANGASKIKNKQATPARPSNAGSLACMPFRLAGANERVPPARILISQRPFRRARMPYARPVAATAPRPAATNIHPAGSKSKPATFTSPLRALQWSSLLVLTCRAHDNIRPPSV